MSALAAQAEAHWKQFRPTAYAAIEDPATFFADLATEAQAQIDSLTDDLSGLDQPGETFAEKASRLAQARFEARATVLREMVLLPEENPETDDGTSPEDREFEAAVTEFQTLRESLRQ